jgi:DNA-binding transcriptional MerR regulator
MPIEELARRTATTVRNLRALQARSLVPPPELEGRKGYYTERHLARVTLVQRLQGRGFSLASIEELLRSWEAGSGLIDVMGLEDALVAPIVSTTQSEVDVAEAFPELLQHPRALAMALEQELVIARDGHIVAPDAELLSIVERQVAAGYPLVPLLEEGALLIADLERIAARFRQSFFTHISDPLLLPGASHTRVAEVAEKVARLRPLSMRAVNIILARAIERGAGSISVIPPEPSARLPKPPGTRRSPAKRGSKGAHSASRRKRG